MTETRVALTHIDPFLACPHCGNTLMRENNALVSPCGKTYFVKDECAYFDLPPEDYEQNGTGPNVEQSQWGKWRQHNYEYFKKAFAALPDTAIVCDIGAGPGQFGDITKRFPQFISMDFRPFPPVNVVTDLTKTLPLRAGSVDAVMASNVFEHIPNTLALLQELHRILAPGGVLVATTPFLMRVHQKPYDFNRYTHYQWSVLLESAGFEVVDVQGLSSPYEVYETMHRHFFAIELERAGSVRRMVLRAFRFLDRMRLFLLRAVSSRNTSDEYTEGYGVIARVINSPTT